MPALKNYCNIARREFNKISNGEIIVFIHDGEIIGKSSLRITKKHIYVSVLFFILDNEGHYNHYGYSTKISRFYDKNEAYKKCFLELMPELNEVGFNFQENGIKGNIAAELRRNNIDFCAITH